MRSINPPGSSWQTKGVTLCQVHPLPEDKTSTDVDVIAVHGLDTESPGTWTYRFKDPMLPSVNWLMDKPMLPSTIPRTRIFTCDWPADLFESSNLMPKTITEIARCLLLGIKSRPPGTDNDSLGSHSRPIVFIASCLGGVILMKALLMASGEYLSVARATRGIIFLATPFRGTSFSKIAKFAEPALGLKAGVQGQYVSTLLDYVQQTFDSTELIRDFTVFCKKNGLDQNLRCCYENGTTSLLRKAICCVPRFLLQQKPLVSMSSATLDIIPHPILLDRSHVLMNKFYGPEDQGYKRVAAAIEDLVLEAVSGQPIEIADAWIRTNRYSQTNLQIKRLSDKALPMAQCYINLTIVKKVDEEDSRSKSVYPSRHGLFGIPMFEESVTEASITLQGLFELRNTCGDNKRPSRILIRGRAGVGKTTLCKKIVYEFTHGTLWQELFDRILWVPLRNLKLEERRRIAGYNLKNLFYHEYFSQHPKGEKLAEALHIALTNKERAKTLFVLDGLDEVSLDLGHDMSLFLEELLNQSNVIITSRPNAVLPSTLRALDFELETVGFSPDQVITYVENVTVDPTTRTKDETLVNQIREFLDSHKLIGSLMRIPIQLEAFCYTWGVSRKKQKPDTMTAIYIGIEDSLWRKDAGNLGHPCLWNMHPNEVKRIVRGELYLLEALAFTGIHNEIISFEPKHREAVSEHFNTSDNGLCLDDMLGRVSFVRSSNTSPANSNHDLDYHFMHLTFQEYFGAMYFVRQWKATKNLKLIHFDEFGESQVDEVDPRTFFGQNKYNPRYNICWRFAMGLLKPKEHSSLFRLLEEEPRDLLGPAHHWLVLDLLGEARTLPASQHPLKPEKLSEWLVLECELTASSHAATHPGFPDEALHIALKTEYAPSILKCEGINYSEATSSIIAQLLSTEFPPSGDELQRGSIQSLHSKAFEALSHHIHLPETIVTTLAEVLRKTDSSVNESTRTSVIDLLGKQLKLPETVMTTLVELLKSTDPSVNESTRASVVRVLEVQSNLPETVMTTLVELLKSTDPSVQEVQNRAAAVLAHHSKLSQETIISLIGLLQCTNLFVQNAASPAFIEQLDLSQTTVAILSRLSENANSSVQDAVLKLLLKQSIRSQKIITALEQLLSSMDLFAQKAAVALMCPCISLSSYSLLLYDMKRQLNLQKSCRRQSLAEAGPLLEVVGLDLSEATITRLAELLKSPDLSVRNDAATTLNKQLRLPESVVTTLVQLLQDPRQEVRLAAAESFEERSDLSVLAIGALAQLLQDPSDDVRCAAARAFRRQPTLPEPVVTTFVKLLQDSSDDVRCAAADTLYGRSDLPEAVITLSAKLLQDPERKVRAAAANLLSRASKLTEAVAITVVKLFQEDRSEIDAVRWIFSNQDNWSPALVTAFIELLQNKSYSPDLLQAAPTWMDSRILRFIGFTRKLADTSTRSTLYLPNIEALYGVFLCWSFKEQFVLSLNKELRLCTIQSSSGLWQATVENSDEFLAAIERARKKYNPNGLKLW